MANENSAFTKSKEFLVLIPLLGSALAIIYDVGFFVGLNIGYFTFFSLNEHIVFALEVLPFALLLAMTVLISAYILRPKPRVRRHPIYVAIQLSFILIVTIVGAIFSTPILMIGAGLITFFGVLLSHSDNLRERLIISCATAAIVAFYFGYLVAVGADQTVSLPHYLGRFKTQYTTTIDTKSSGAIEAKLIRSGDRGVLFLMLKTIG
jgi:hypothetical protein